MELLDLYMNKLICIEMKNWYFVIDLNMLYCIFKFLSFEFFLEVWWRGGGGCFYLFVKSGVYKKYVDGKMNFE